MYVHKGQREDLKKGRLSKEKGEKASRVDGRSWMRGASFATRRYKVGDFYEVSSLFLSLSGLLLLKRKKEEKNPDVVVPGPLKTSLGKERKNRI